MTSLHQDVDFYKIQKDTLQGTPRPPQQPADDAPMVEWAKYYARLGLKVVPGHTPLFDDTGNCTGCTCEDYKRSEKYRKWLTEQGRGREFNPDYKCPTPGKHPRFSKWQVRATSDEATIIKYWRWWPDANVGHNPGRAEFGPERRPLIMLDGDSYKDNYAGDELALPSDTPTALTGNLGEHDYFYMPRDKAYGQHTGDMPAGVDIRGVDGFDILHPSLHPSGRRYQWELDLSLGDIEPKELPQHVIDLIESHDGRKGAEIGPSDIVAVQHSSELVEQLLHHAELDNSGAQTWGDGRRWILHECPFNPADDPHAADGGSFIVIYQDGTIGAGCHHNRCQHAIKESGLSGWGLLKQKVGYTPAGDAGKRAEFDDYRDWLQSALGTAALQTLFARTEGPRKVLDALLCQCLKQGDYMVSIGTRRLGELCGMSHPAVGKILKRLADGGFLDIEAVDKGLLPRITLRPCSQVSTYSLSPKGDKVESYDQGRRHYQRNRADDAYISGHGAYKKKRIEMGLSEGTPPMGPAALLIVSHLRAYGQMSRSQLQQSTGLGQGSVTTAIRRLVSYGQIEVVGTGARGTKIYAMTQHASEALEAMRPEMQTHGVGLRRKIKNFELVMQRWRKRYPNRRTAPEDVRAKMDWMDNHYEKMIRQDAQTMAYLHRREAQTGIKTTVAVAHNIRGHRRFTEENRYDRGEEWATNHKPAWETWQELSDLTAADRYRMMEIAGYTRDEIRMAIHWAGKMGRAPRQFVGVGTQAVAA